MGTRSSNRTRLHALTCAFCLLLVLSLILLYLTRDPDGFNGRNPPTGTVYWNDLPIPAEGATRLTIPLEEVAIRRVEERVRHSFLTGDYARTDRGCEPDVKYPPCKSDTPLYGRTRFTGGEAGTSWNVHFALDHSEGTPGAYDLLYLDENGDFDLGNDTPRRPLQDVNGLPVIRTAKVESIWFEPVQVPFHFEDQSQQLIELLPRLWRYENRDPQLSLVAARIRRGRFEFGRKSYEAYLGYGSTITGSLDRAFSRLQLVGPDGEQPNLLGHDQLNLMRSLGGRWCQFSCTPMGDQLFIYPYEGPVGVLRLGAGGRDVQRLELSGDLRTSGARVGLGRTLANGLCQGESHYEIPVGDYCPEYLDVIMGNVRFAISSSPHGAPSGRYRGDRAVCSIGVREDRPFVLDFSHKPRVVFLRRHGDDRFARGDQVRVEAVLIDPVQHVMFRGFGDMSQSEVKTYTLPDGQKRTFEWAPALEPRVVIKRRNGAVVAQGVMPFG